MALVRSVLFAILFYVLTTVMVIVGLPITLVSRRGTAHHTRLWARLYLMLARTICGVRLRIEGVPPAEPVLVAAKHESVYETLALVALIDDPIIVLKRELAAIPLFGRLVRRHGSIAVDRAASATAMRALLHAADAAKAQHRAVLIFPEGTRVRHGEAPDLQAGFAGLYGRLGLPVVPVATDAGVVWPRGLVKRSGIVTLRFGETLPPGQPRRDIERRVHAAINVLNG